MGGFICWLYDFVITRTLLEQFVAVVFGVLLALYLDRRLASRQEKQRRGALRESLQDALAKNAALVRQLQGGLASSDTHIPTYPMDRELLDATASEKYSVGLSAEVCRAIDHARYEIRHLDEQLRMLRDAGSQLDSPRSTRNFYLEVRRATIQHLPLVEAAIAAAQAALGR
jgi:hypothetical protein